MNNSARFYQIPAPRSELRAGILNISAQKLKIWAEIMGIQARFGQTGAEYLEDYPRLSI
jgi:hypothetical protein